MGKCPKCDAFVTNVNISDVTVAAIGGARQWRGIAYECQMCHAVLSVAIDPVALKTDIVDDVVHELKKHLR